MKDKNQARFFALKDHFINEGINHFSPVVESEISVFESTYDVSIPYDFKDYFTLINGSHGVPLDNLYEFYNLDRLKRIFNEFKDWEGVPDYNKLDFQKFKNVFIFGNYEFNFYSFGIELFSSSNSINRVFIFCGSEYKLIAETFEEFIDIYINTPEEIFI